MLYTKLYRYILSRINKTSLIKTARTYFPTYGTARNGLFGWCSKVITRENKNSENKTHANFACSKVISKVYNII